MVPNKYIFMGIIKECIKQQVRKWIVVSRSFISCVIQKNASLFAEYKIQRRNKSPLKKGIILLRLFFYYNVLKKQPTCFDYGTSAPISFSQIRNKYDLQAFIQLLLEYDVISFDIFDTLVLRSVTVPTKIFEYIERENHWKDFSKKRIIAEHLAREEAKEISGSGEVTLTQIYEKMDFDLNSSIQDSVQIEYDTENQYCAANKVFLQIVNELKKSNKILICVSDMYLSKGQLTELLRSKGYPMFDEVIVSSEERVSKYDGKLFEVVKNRYPNRTIIHIGDQLYSDYIQARIHGISSVYYSGNSKRK